jgi:hypothetical protein
MLYRIRNAFYDGQVVHPIDSVLDFVEGTQPKTAVPAEDSEPTGSIPADYNPSLAVNLDEATAGDTLHSLTVGKKK